MAKQSTTKKQSQKPRKAKAKLVSKAQTLEETDTVTPEVQAEPAQVADARHEDADQDSKVVAPVAIDEPLMPEPADQTDTASDREHNSDEILHLGQELSVSQAEQAAESLDATIEQASMPHPQEVKRSGLSMIFGGAFAAALGCGAAVFFELGASAKIDAIKKTIAEQSQSTEALQEKLQKFSTVERVDALDASIQTVLQSPERIMQRLDALDARLTTLEKQPSADGTLQSSAIEAFQREIDALRQQTSDLSSNAASALASTKAQADAMAERAKRATARDVLLTLKENVSRGASFVQATNALGGVLNTPLPQALVDNKNGVQSLSQLQQSFPSAARDALSQARQEGVSGEETGGFSGFLREQLNVRSVEAIEGNSVDAVLSRAGESLRQGELKATLAEIDTLPDVAKMALSDWLTAAQARQQVDTALAELSLSLTQE